MNQGFHEAPRYDRRTKGVGSDLRGHFPKQELSEAEAHKRCIKVKLGGYLREQIRLDSMSLAAGDAFINANADMLAMERNIK